MEEDIIAALESKPVKKKRNKSFNSYKLQDMVNEMNELMDYCYKRGHTGVILNIILTKARLKGIYNPLSAVPTAKITKEASGDVNVSIVSYKDVVND